MDPFNLYVFQTFFFFKHLVKHRNIIYIIHLTPKMPFCSHRENIVTNGNQ